MAKVNICNVEVLDNPASFFDSFKFQITFECHEPLDDDLEWKLVYVSSAYNSSLDQTLDSILVGPVPVGRHQFLFEADAPDPKKIPNEDIVGVTVVLIQALYRDKEFIRVGYYVNNEYKKEELRLEPPAEPILEELERHIIASDPRVTRFPIDWGDGLLDGCPEPEQPAEDNEDKSILADSDEAEDADDNPDPDPDQDEPSENRIQYSNATDENVSQPPNSSKSESNLFLTQTQSSGQQQQQHPFGSQTSSGLPLHQVQSSVISIDTV